MKHAVGTMFAAVIISVVCTSPCAQAKVLPDTARLIPPETVLLVDVDNFDQLKTQFEKTNLYKFYKDPAMAAFVEAFKTKRREKIQKLDGNDILKAIVDADVLPRGRVAFALVLNKRAIDANEPLALFITQWGENSSKIKEAVDKTVKKAIEDGLHQRSEDYRGVSIKTIIAEGSSRLGYGFSSTLSYCFIDDCLIGSEDIEVLKFVIAHIKGATSPTLAGDADYTAAAGAIGPYHDIDFYVNIKQIIKTIVTEDTTGKAQSTIANLGLSNVSAFGCSIGLGRVSGSSCCGKAFLKINGAKKGVCKILDAESAVLRAPRFIPASAYSATFLNLDIKKAYNELYSILYNFSPAYAAIMHTPLLPPSPDGEPGLELKSDIVEHLGSQIVIAQSTRKPFSSSSMPTEMLVALAVNNRSALEKSISLLYSKMDPDATRELLGHTIYLVGLPPLPFSTGGVKPLQDPAVPGAPQLPKLAFTITDTHLIFAVEASVERAIRTLSGTGAVSMDSAKWFNSTKSAIPSLVGLAGLQDNAASGEFFWWMMKEGGKSKAEDSSISMGLSVDSKSLSPHLMFSQAGLFDTSLLPQFDAVRKYFGMSAFYGISRPDGFFFEFKYLNPTTTD